MRTHINADDRFVARGPDRVAPSGRANHFYNNIVWREPFAISQVILTFYQPPHGAVLYLWTQKQLRYALRRMILQSLDASTLLSTAAKRDAWLWEAERALIVALRARAGLGVSDASGWLYPARDASPHALPLHTGNT